MTCIFCGVESEKNQVCEECKEAFLDYKVKYFIKKTAKETILFDEETVQRWFK